MAYFDFLKRKSKPNLFSQQGSSFSSPIPMPFELPSTSTLVSSTSQLLPTHPKADDNSTHVIDNTNNLFGYESGSLGSQRAPAVDYLQTVTAWLMTPSYRDERLYLEAHPELLSVMADNTLGEMITGIEESFEHICRDTRMTREQIERQIRDIYEHRQLLADIRKRGGSLQIIREVYVDWHSGFVLDVPAWLGEVVHQSVAMRQSINDISQTAYQRLDLWRSALARGEHEHLTPEILAEVHTRVWDALDDINDSAARLQSYAERVSHLEFALTVYTVWRYPRRHAINLRNLQRTRTKGDEGNNRGDASNIFPG
jgi:hypothetical protein